MDICLVVNSQLKVIEETAILFVLKYCSECAQMFLYGSKKQVFVSDGWEKLLEVVNVHSTN